MIVVAIFLFVNLKTSFTGTTSVSVINESVTPDGPTLVYVSGSSNCSFSDFVVTSIKNSSITLDVGNYTAGSSGSILNLTSEFVDSSWNVSYTYTWGDSACEASQDMTDEFGNFTSLLGLIGVIIFLGLVIGVLVASFAFGENKV